MSHYVALLRGIGPGNPKLHNRNLQAALESAGCTDVKPVLASGNLVFTSSARSVKALESKLEAALKQKTGIALAVVVLDRDELDALIKRDPFKGAVHGKEWYLTVTFRKDRSPPVCSQLDRARMDGPQFMTDLEKKYGRQITTRTWNTLLKIRAKMPE